MNRPHRLRRVAAAVTLFLVAATAPARAAGPPRAIPTSPEHRPLNLAILVFDGVQVIDFTGPFEVLTQAFWPGGAMFNVYTVADSARAIDTSPPWGGLTLTPRYTFATAPRADVVVLPGGGVNSHFDKPAYLNWIRAQADSATYVMSVCNGAYFLAKAGLLDGLKATSTASLIDGLKEIAPTCQLVYDQRFVDNGKIITTAGLSSGIDGALHLVERVGGHELAAATALGIEYDWRPDSGFVRAALADRWLRKMLGRAGFEFGDKVQGWRVLHQEGDRDTWTKAWEFQSTADAATLMPDIDRKLAESWQKKDGHATARDGASHWTFTAADSGRWKAAANLEKATDAVPRYRFELRLDRVATAESPAGNPAKEESMKRVTGLGGVFLKFRDPKAQLAWYEEHLGLEAGKGFNGGLFHWREADEPQRKAVTTWSFFPSTSKYFDPSPSPFMLNFRVKDLHALLAALRAEGVTVQDKVDESEYGKFGWIIDPEGNKIELWEPPVEE